MSASKNQPRPEFHPAQWDAIMDQVRRMIEVRSILDCVRYVLTNEEDMDVEGAVSIAHDVLDDVIEKLDSVELRKSVDKWLTEHGQAPQD